MFASDTKYGVYCNITFTTIRRLHVYLFYIYIIFISVSQLLSKKQRFTQMWKGKMKGKIEGKNYECVFGFSGACVT